MTEQCELAVVGAGPGGLAAAAMAANSGVDVAVFDEQPEPGGQIYRAVERSPIDRQGILGSDYGQGADLVSAFRRSTARYYPESVIWLIKPNRELGVLSGGDLRYVKAERILIATGAMERAMPFAGWTLPGVMTAGAGQVMLKSSGLVPAGKTVIAGMGPLLWLAAWQYRRAGVAVEAVLNFSRRRNYMRALPHLPMAALAGPYLRKGLAMIREVRAAGVPVFSGVSDLRAHGTGRVESIEFRTGSRRRAEEVDMLLVHFGVVPRTDLTMSIRARHDWDAGQACWRPWTDEWGNTDVEAVQVLGDAAGIDGAAAAEMAGRIASLEAMRAVGRIGTADRDRMAAPYAKTLRRDRRVRPFLEALFQPSDALLSTLPDDVVVCRCEEVTAGDIRAATVMGCKGANEVKYATRSGMGPCQGRQCGLAVSRIIANTLGLSIEEVGAFRIRPPVKPIAMGQLAALAPEPEIP